MASASKTPNLNLPQWVETEKPERTDFNAAFDAIDDEFASLLEGGEVYQATLQNGWTGTLTYKKNDLGQVSLKGELTAGTVAANTVVSTLPAGYQPTARTGIPVIITETGNGAVGLYMNQTSGLLRVTANSGFTAGNSILFSVIFDVN